MPQLVRGPDHAAHMPSGEIFDIFTTFRATFHRPEQPGLTVRDIARPDLLFGSLHVPGRGPPRTLQKCDERHKEA